MTRSKMFIESMMGNSTVMFSVDYRSNLSSISWLNVVSFADNTASNSNGNLDGPSNNYNMKFNPTTAIIILVLFSFIIGIAFYTFCIRRRLRSSGNSGAFRVAGVDDGSTAEAVRGLERSVIESFPVFSYNLVKAGLESQGKGSECAVCLTEFEDHELLRLLPKCSHAFHPECIDTWLCTNTTCPLCRTSLLPAQADSNATATTDFGVAEAELCHEQLAVVADDGGGVSRRGNESTGESLIMELREGNEWYIVTADGLAAGLYSSFAGKHQTSASAEERSKSERWGSISINPASFLRTFSMRVAAGDREEGGTELSDGGSGSSRHAYKWSA